MQYYKPFWWCFCQKKGYAYYQEYAILQKFLVVRCFCQKKCYAYYQEHAILQNLLEVFLSEKRLRILSRICNLTNLFGGVSVRKKVTHIIKNVQYFKPFWWFSVRKKVTYIIKNMQYYKPFSMEMIRR